MPLKKGPNGSFRMYSSSNGRYVKMSFELKNSLLSSKKQNRTKEDKRKKRTNYLRERARCSKDPGLYEIFDFLESKIPHYVQYVNEDLYIPNEHKSRETDIIGKNAIIEIKMGHRGNKLRQLIAQKEVANARGLKSIVYCPNIPFNARREFQKNGVNVAKNKEELYQEIVK